MDKSLDLFAGTPPLEAKKMLMMMATTHGIGTGVKDHLKIDFIDVSRAYFHARARREVFIKLPPEDHEDGMCGKLVKAMYGTRDAAQNWEMEYTGFMIEDGGFTQCSSTPCMFWNEEKNLRVVIHGDDFTVLGCHTSLMWFREKIKTKFEVKLRGMLGPSSKDASEITILNRVVSWDRNGITYKADPRHVDIVINELGLKDAKAVSSPQIDHKEMGLMSCLMDHKRQNTEHVWQGSTTWHRIGQTYNTVLRNCAGSCHAPPMEIGRIWSGYVGT